MDRGGPATSLDGADGDLVERLRDGDREALAELYEAHRLKVSHFIRSRVGDSAEVEDLTQETFAQAIRSIDGFEGRSRLSTWLFGIARFVILRSWRFSNRWVVGSWETASSDEPIQNECVEERLEARLFLQRCRDILSASASAESGRMFELRYGADHSIPEIASQVGKSRHAVKASLHRSRRLIQHRLGHTPEAFTLPGLRCPMKVAPMDRRAPGDPVAASV